MNHTRKWESPIDYRADSGKTVEEGFRIGTSLIQDCLQQALILAVTSMSFWLGMISDSFGLWYIHVFLQTLNSSATFSSGVARRHILQSGNSFTSGIFSSVNRYNSHSNAVWFADAALGADTSIEAIKLYITHAKARVFSAISVGPCPKGIHTYTNVILLLDITLILFHQWQELS